MMTTAHTTMELQVVIVYVCPSTTYSNHIALMILTVYIVFEEKPNEYPVVGHFLKV